MMNRPISKLAASMLAIAAAQVATSAYAAEADAAADAAPAESQADSSGLTDIVVTATKRETNLQKTPIAISVLGNEDIQKRHVQSLYDLADGAIPSLRIATFEARQSALTIGIRGIVPLDANQPAREQGVGIYIDGVYLGRQHGLNAGLFEVERIEVLKGPQGTLFGRNTEGGALSIVSRPPTGELGGNIGGGVGNYGSYNMDAHVNLPKFAGFSIKLDGIVQHQDATTQNPMAGQEGFNQYHRWGGRVAVRWQPTDNITNDFSYDLARDENTPFYSQLLNYNPNGCVSGAASAAPACAAAPGTAFTTLTGTVRPLLPGVVVNGTSRMDVADIGVPQAVSVDKTHGFTNVLKWKIAPELELRSITAWRGVDVEQWDNSGGAHRVPVVAPGCTGTSCYFSRYSLADLRQRQFSQELQAVGTIGNIDYVAGLYYFNEHVSDDAATPSSMAISGYTTAGQTTGYTYSAINLCTPGAAAAPGTVGPATNGCAIDRASEVWSKSYAAFGQVTWHATDRLAITVGGRYTHDTKYGVLHWSRSVNYDVTPPAASVGYKPLDKTWNRFNPMATVAFEASDNINLYAKYATGYRAGGASSRTSDYRAFDPEDVKSYEIGFKSDFWNHRARFNVAAYLMDRKNSQVDLSTIQVIGTSAFNNLVTFNAPGTTKIRGIEADLTVKPTNNLTLGLSYAYTYTDVPLVPVRYDEIVSGVATGNFTIVPQKFYIVFTPRNAASGSVDYAQPIGGNGTELRLHLDANYSQATQAFDQFATLNEASFIVNGRLSLADIPMRDGGQKLTLSAWVRNMFDEQYIFRRDPSNSVAQVNTAAVTAGNIGNTIGDYGNFNAPRTFGLDAKISF